MLHVLDFPYNGETWSKYILGDGKITDNKHHLWVLSPLPLFIGLTTPSSVRNHGGVPDIDPDVFEVEIGGLVNKPIKISLKDLKDPNKFPCVERHI